MVPMMSYLLPVEVQCPFCWEEFTLTVDTSQGDYSTIEDCSVCCRPIEFSITCSPGEVESVEASI